MFTLVSNPFMEMAQGVATNGLGYVTERSEKSESFAWLWWIAGAIITIVGLIFLSNHQQKKEEERKRLEEEQKKLSENQKKITS